MIGLENGYLSALPIVPLFVSMPVLLPISYYPTPGFLSGDWNLEAVAKRVIFSLLLFDNMGTSLLFSYFPGPGWSLTSSMMLPYFPAMLNCGDLGLTV